MANVEKCESTPKKSGGVFGWPFSWRGTLLLLITGVLLGCLAQFMTGALWWLGLVPIFFAFLFQLDKRVAAGRQFSLQGIMLLITVVGVWLALATRPITATVWWFVVLSPYFFALYIARRFIARRFALAFMYFAVHTVACAMTAYLILREPDPVGKWALSLPIMFIDMPISFPIAAWEPPGYVGPLYIFFVGGLFWATVGWFVSRDAMAETPSFPRQPSLFRLSDDEVGVDRKN